MFEETLFLQMLKHEIGCCQKDSIIISSLKDVQSSFRFKRSHFFILERFFVILDMNLRFFTFCLTFQNILRKSFAEKIQSEFAKVIRCNDKTGLKVGVKQKKYFFQKVLHA